MKLIQYLKSTIYGPTLYHEVATFTPGRIFLHAAVLIAIFAASITIAISPLAYKSIDTLQQLAHEKYPADLVLKIEDGVLSSNATKPIILEDKEGKLAFIIDASVSFSGIEQLQQYNTRGLITRDAIVMQRINGQLDIISMAQFDDREITKENIDEVLIRLRDNLPLISLLTFISLCIFGAALGTIYYFILGSTLKFMALVFDKEHVTWLHGTRIGILASTLPIILVSLILAIFGTVLPFLITFFTLVIASINIHAFHKQYTQTQLPL